MGEGWIKLHRNILDNWLWQEKPFDKRSAWIDILLMVNHENKKTLLGNELTTVERGSKITSVRKLCERWGWSNTKVKNFLSLLEKDNMIAVKSDSKKTTLTVVNYCYYQDKSDTKNDTRTTQERQSSDSKTTREHTNKNVKNVKNVKNDKKLYKDIVEYLNEMVGGKFKYTTAKTKTLINARVKEGFTIDDFKRVIDIKAKEWLNDPKMERYLRPETLFGTKFEGYLNQKDIKEQRYSSSSYRRSDEDYARAWGIGGNVENG